MQLTFEMTKLDSGYMIKVKEFPEIMCWSKSKKGLITKLIHSISGYEQAFPNRIKKAIEEHITLMEKSKP